MATFKERTGETWGEFLERNCRYVTGKMSEAEYRTAQRRFNERTQRSSEELQAIGRAILARRNADAR